MCKREQHESYLFNNDRQSNVLWGRTRAFQKKTRGKHVCWVALYNHSSSWYHIRHTVYRRTSSLRSQFVCCNSRIVCVRQIKWYYVTFFNKITIFYKTSASATQKTNKQNQTNILTFASLVDLFRDRVSVSWSLDWYFSEYISYQEKI